MRRSFPARFAFGESIRPQRKYCATTSGQLHRAIAVRPNDSDVMVVIVMRFWWSRGTPVGLPSALGWASAAVRERQPRPLATTRLLPWAASRTLLRTLPMALTPATRLGPFEILGAIGAGAIGEVYRVRAHEVESRRRDQGARPTGAPGRGAGIHGRYGLRRVVRPAAPHDALCRARVTEGRRDRARVADSLARRSDQAISRRAHCVGGGGASGGHPLGASITSSRRSCSWSIPIRRRRGNRFSTLSRRIARRSSSNPFCGKARVCVVRFSEVCRRALSGNAGSR